MGLADVWSRTLVYFGIAEEDDEEWDEDGYATHEELERTYAERPNVRRLEPRRRRGNEFDDWTESQGAAAPPPSKSSLRSLSRRGERNLEVAPSPAPSVQVHLVVPRSF